MKRAAILALIAALPLTAGTIDASDLTYTPLHHGAKVIVDFAVWNYGISNRGYLPYPTGIQLNLVTAEPGAAPTAAPESSGEYYEDYVFSAYLESLDGSISVPLADPIAALLGLGTGRLLLTPGTFASGSSDPIGIGVLYGSVNLSQDAAAALFGPDLAARFVLRNLGPDLVLGIGPGYTIRNSVSEPGLIGAGPASVGGLTSRVTVANPEPGTWLLAACAVTLLAVSSLRSRGARGCKRGRSRP